MLELITFSHLANLVASNALTWTTLATVVLVLAPRTSPAALPLAPDRLTVWSCTGGSDGGR